MSRVEEQLRADLLWALDGLEKMDRNALVHLDDDGRARVVEARAFAWRSLEQEATT